MTRFTLPLLRPPLQIVRPAGLRPLLLCLLGHIMLWSPAPAQAQPSRIELRNHFSAALGIQKSYNIYLPEGYDQDSVRYPVIYLFRGHEREWANPTEDGSRRGNIKTVADGLYARGMTGKMILVMPGMSSSRTAAEYTYLTGDLIPHIDATFRTIPVRQKRGLDGFSYGGVDLLTLVRNFPGLFWTAGCYDGSFWAMNPTELFNGTSESYWTQVRSMRFLLHSTPSGNWSSNLQFLTILSAHGISNAFDTLNIAPNSAHNWSYADLHMERSLPLHWQHFLAGARTVQVSLLAPLPGSSVSGTQAVRWSRGPDAGLGRTIVEVSRDRGSTWTEAYTSTGPDTSFFWNTLLAPDGTGYLLRLRFLGDTSYGFVQMAGRFTVNNPGNALPEAGILSPDSAVSISGLTTVRWWAEDADGDSLSIALDVTPDQGRTWEHLANLSNTGSYVWTTGASPNSPFCRVRITARDAASSGSALSGPFALANHRPLLLPSLIRHVAGSADGRIEVRATDPPQLTGHTYRVTFPDTVPGVRVYSVLDLDRGAVVLDRSPLPPPGAEGPAFDGLRLMLADHDPPILSEDSTRWVTGNCNLLPDISVPTFDPGTGPITGKAYVSDYRILVHDRTVDTSEALFGWPPAPMNFTVRNVTEDHPVSVLFTDLDGDRTIGPYDDLILLEKDSLGGPLVTWELFFQGPAVPILPSPGDLFLLKFLKPFTRNDVYEFRALPGGLVAVPPPEAPLSFALDQNYPNPFNGGSTIGFRIDAPGPVELTVYDLLGREVAAVVRAVMTPGSHAVQFDGGRLASGVYLYRLKAGGKILTKRMILLR